MYKQFMYGSIGLPVYRNQQLILDGLDPSLYFLQATNN